MVAAPRVASTASRVLYEALASVFTCLGFDALDDKVFQDLAIARIVEPTSIRDTGRVLTDLGCQPASEKAMRRTLTRAHTSAYRAQIARLCFAHAPPRRLTQPIGTARPQAGPRTGRPRCGAIA